ncbi:MAG: hypothetical protein Q8928_10640 [Bacteroidota bacterium]|nr:hypothetical protein [Bacteroidota bacterium]
MSGIAEDAQSWFESGYVRDVSVKNNLFEKCEEPIINIHPENSEVDSHRHVHERIEVYGNRFNVK